MDTIVDTPAAAPPADTLAPRHTSFTAIGATLAAMLGQHASGSRNTPVASPRRDACLRTVRDAALRHIRHDLQYNTAALRDYARCVSTRRNMLLERVPIIADLFDRLGVSRATLCNSDPFRGTLADDQRFWPALQQFYHDAIDLAERLCDYDDGAKRRRIPAVTIEGDLRQTGLPGLSAYARPQGLVNAACALLADPFEVRPLRTIGPTLAQLTLSPGGARRHTDWFTLEQSTLGWLSPDGLARLMHRRDYVVRAAGRRAFETNPALFDRGTGRTRANVIIAVAQRAGLLDVPLIAGVLRDLPHAMCIGERVLLPGWVARRRNGDAVLSLTDHRGASVHETLNRSLHLLAHERRALVVTATAGPPIMPYGQNRRMRAGVRLVADECLRRTGRFGRRTFVVPVTLNDPVGFLTGRTHRIVVSIHPPLEIIEPWSAFGTNPRQDRTPDPLLSHLEALFFAGSILPAHGLRTPQVVPAVQRARRAARRCGLRAWLRGRFNTTVRDLAWGDGGRFLRPGPQPDSR